MGDKVLAVSGGVGAVALAVVLVILRLLGVEITEATAPYDVISSPERITWPEVAAYAAGASAFLAWAKRVIEAVLRVKPKQEDQDHAQDVPSAGGQ